MKNKKVLLALCAVLLVAATVFGTLAYLTSTDEVINTFTVGKVEITLDEADVDENGVVETEARVKANTYKLMPGHSYIKDPTVHVADTSEDCWLFVKVDNQIAGIEAVGDTTIAAQMAANGWTAVSGETGVYAYKETVSAGDDVLVFGTFTIAGNADVADYGEAEITVTAYAVQADGFASAEAAWTAAKTELGA